MYDELVARLQRGGNAAAARVLSGRRLPRAALQRQIDDPGAYFMQRTTGTVGRQRIEEYLQTPVGRQGRTFMQEVEEHASGPAGEKLAALRNRLESQLGGEEWEAAVDTLREIAYAVNDAAAVRVPAVAPELRGAELISDEDLAHLTPATTLAIRAQNSGDMYHLRAAMIIEPGATLLIWDVHEQTRAQAQQIVDLHADLEGHRIVYTARERPDRITRTETVATELVARFLTKPTVFDALRELQRGAERHVAPADEPQELAEARASILETAPQALKLLGMMPELADMLRAIGRRLEITRLAEQYGAYSGDEAEAFERDLREHGFVRGRPYVIVLFRATGHSRRPGANAPALDTGREGLRQIITLVTEQLGPEVSVVPMGEQPAGWSGANLLHYWKWPSAPDRRRQLSLLRYLRDQYTIVGAVGMRSGVLDSLAFAGIKILSIDISPHRIEELPSNAPSKGWGRGLKLEQAYGEAYGRVFVERPREGDLERGLQDPESWPGAFHGDDLASIGDALKLYFKPDEGPTGRHESHPLAEAPARRAVERLSAMRIDNYGLDRVIPYLNGIHQHAAALPEDVAEAVARKRDAALEARRVAEQRATQMTQTVVREAGVARGAKNALSIEWMAYRRKMMQGLLAPGPEDRIPEELLKHADAAANVLGIYDRGLAVRIYRATDQIYCEPAKL